MNLRIPTGENQLEAGHIYSPPSPTPPPTNPTPHLQPQRARKKKKKVEEMLKVEAEIIGEEFL